MLPLKVLGTKKVLTCNTKVFSHVLPPQERIGYKTEEAEGSAELFWCPSIPQIRSPNRSGGCFILGGPGFLGLALVFFCLVSFPFSLSMWVAG